MPPSIPHPFFHQRASRYISHAIGCYPLLRRSVVDRPQRKHPVAFSRVLFGRHFGYYTCFTHKPHNAGKDIDDRPNIFLSTRPRTLHFKTPNVLFYWPRATLPAEKETGAHHKKPARITVTEKMKILGGHLMFGHVCLVPIVP